MAIDDELEAGKMTAEGSISVTGNGYHALVHVNDESGGRSSSRQDEGALQELQQESPSTQQHAS